jgi:hypothetical protein
MTRASALLAGVWEFVVGDDWRTALGVVLALSLTALLAGAAISAWWVMPIAVPGLLALSIRRALHAEVGRLVSGGVESHEQPEASKLSSTEGE